MNQELDSRELSSDFDILAPDGSEIRLLSSTDRGSMVHCTLNPGEVSLPVAHWTVDEVWYVIEGTGQMWRKYDDDERIDELTTGVSLSIPVGACFQFRNTGESPLRILIVTMPPWPGEDEAYSVPGRWPVKD